MAELTLTQRSEMANNSLFQQRLTAAVKKTANYWDIYVLDALPKYNAAVQKKKRFAASILNGGGLQGILQPYTEYFLSQYNDPNPSIIVDDADPAKGQLTDDVLMDSSASAATFDYFAKVEPGDDTRPVEGA